MKKVYQQREKSLMIGVNKTREIEAFNKLVEFDRKAKEAKYQNVPTQYIPRTKFDDRTSNGLSNMIISWFTLNGHKAWRQSSEGRYRPGEKVTDVLGHVRQMKGTWLPGQNIGQSDVAAIVAGQFVAIEVKIGLDKQSEAQKKYQKEITDSGATYVIARTFGQFMEWYEKEIEV